MSPRVITYGPHAPKGVGHIARVQIEATERWIVIDDTSGVEMFSAVWFFPKARCRLWGLWNRYGWLRDA